MSATKEDALAIAVRLIKSGDGNEKAKEIFRLMGLDFESELNKLWVLMQKNWDDNKSDRSTLHHAVLETVYGVNIDGSVRYILSVSSVSSTLEFSHRVLDSHSTFSDELNAYPLKWPGKGVLLDTSYKLAGMAKPMEGVELSSFSTDLNFPPPTQGQVSARVYESLGDYLEIYAIGLLQETISIDGDEPFYLSSCAKFGDVPRVYLGGMEGYVVDKMKRHISSILTSASSTDAATRAAEMETGVENPFRLAMVKLLRLPLMCQAPSEIVKLLMPELRDGGRFHHFEVLDWKSLYKVHTCAVDMRLTLVQGEKESYSRCKLEPLTPEDWEHIEALAVGLEAAYLLRTTQPSKASAPVIACDAASTLFWHCEQLKAKTATPGPIADVAEAALRRWEGIIFSGRSVLGLAMCMLPWVRFKGIKAVFPSQSLADLERQLLEELARAGDSPLPSDRTSPLDAEDPLPPLVVDKPAILRDYLHSPRAPPHPSTLPQRSERYYESRYPVKDWAEPDRDGLEYFGSQMDTFGVHYHIARLGIRILTTPVITYEERVRAQGEKSDCLMRKRLIKTSLDKEDRHRMWTLHEELNRNPGMMGPTSHLGKRRRGD